MLIVCPQCATSYQVEPQSLGPDGRSVRCARCRNVWFAAPAALMPAVSAADEFEIIDNGPRIPPFEAPPEREIATAEPEPADAWEQAEAAGEELAVLDEPSPVPIEEAEPASISGIDLAGLSADMEGERAQQAAEADAVLAEVTGEITVADAPPLAPQIEPGQPPQAEPTGANSTEGEDIETFAARRARREALRRKSRQWPVPGLPTIILALVAANAILIAWRADIVRLLPQTAPLYAAVGLPVNLRGLAFEDVRMTRDEHDGIAVLAVEGSIVNVTGRALEVPRLRLAVRNADQNEIYTWTMLSPRSVLGPGEVLAFRSRLASPPPEGRDVLVRFFNRRDIVAGMP